MAHGVITDYQCGCVVIKDKAIPFTLKISVAAIPDPSMCDRMISILNTITIPGRAVQLLDFSTPNEPKNDRFV